jgi:hypothetical protein
MTKTLQVPLRPTTKFRPQQEISRILTAAVINARFRQMLLSNPASAIAMGFGGEAFHLGIEEKKCLASIQATSLADFASQLARAPEISKISASYSAGD